MVSTLIRPDSGKIEVCGHDATQDPLSVRARIGYHTGDTGLYARLSPREFLHYFAKLNSLPRSLADERVETLIETFGISEFAGRLCGNLSTGQGQRVSLARTLLADPPVIVFDEPTSGLDIVSAQFILDALRAFAASGRAVLFSTHIMSEVELICDRVVMLHRGEVVQNGTVQEIVKEAGEPNLTRAFLKLIGPVAEASA
ncbi:MAG: sodium transport system ATP-binding protein [Bradymonadia bacterium]|jgi:sodium transport system ATP-binding protein